MYETKVFKTIILPAISLNHKSAGSIIKDENAGVCHPHNY